jgi:diguanylate cyclase (GGDEF)-like protein
MQRDGGHAAVVLVDISQLATINDEFGVDVGDEALKRVGDCLAQTKRANDIVARAGDDEFALLLPDCGKEGAEAFIARARSWLKEQPLRASRDSKSYTLWIGLCAGYGICDSEGSGPDEALAAAIDCLGSSREERDVQQSRWSTAA